MLKSRWKAANLVKRQQNFCLNMNEEPELLVSDPEGLVSVLEAEVLDLVPDSYRV